MFCYLEYCDIYLVLGQCRGNFILAVRKYELTYPNRRSPSNNLFQTLNRRRETRQLESNRPRSVKRLFLEYVEDNPGCSIRGIDRTLGIPKCLVHLVLGNSGSKHCRMLNQMKEFPNFSSH
ncbi:hypothetical protein BDFB_010305, partial [Asbolus verrucosus]